MKYCYLLCFLVVFFVGCASHTPAPVINRSPSSSANASSTSNDWRPDLYTVKKGDTLYSIGLEFGYDYREIAATNNIYAPYTIKVGQQLNFASLNKKTSAEGAKPDGYENEDGVIVTPIDAEPTIESESPSQIAVTEPAAIPTLTGPKAIREPYSKAAFNRITPVVETPTKVQATEETTETNASSTPANTKPAIVDGVAWSWPTQGNVSSKFNGSSNKGIDIAGTKGQAIKASANGKVIYTGSDLRGYGKLVIVKHSPTLLSVYAHNSKINVKEGQIVKAGQKIAEMGDTDADATKLHFEIRQKGKSVNPEPFLPKY